MSLGLICRKCHNGLYIWIEPDRPNLDNRKMKCKACGFIETLKELVDRKEIEEKK